MNPCLKSLLIVLFLSYINNAYAQSAWQIYQYPKAGCSADFPEQPTTAQERDVWTAQAKSKDIIYQIVVNLNKQYAKNNFEAIIAESIDGFINPATDKIEKTETLTISNLPAKQVHVRSQDGTYLVFCTIVNNTALYQIAVAGTNMAQTVASAKRFLDSLKIQ